MAIVNRHVETAFASTSRAAAAYNSDDLAPAADIRGVRCFIDVTVDGGGTVDFKLQGKSPQGDYYDITGAAAAQLGAVGNEELTVYPGIGETANEAVSDVMPGEFRGVLTVGVAAMTASVEVEYLP